MSVPFAPQALAAILIACLAPASAGALTGDDPGEFEQHVLPLLETHCFECHGPDAERVKGGLRMTGRPSLVAGGSSGPAVVPGHPEASLFMQALLWDDPLLEMPPSGRLDDESTEVLRAWIAGGAEWPGGGPGADEDLAAVGDAGGDGLDLEVARARWPFTPVVRPAVPEVAGGTSVRNPIDAFVLARLAAEGLDANPPATARTLARRASFDLLGLPPSLDRVQAFADDPSDDAWAKLLDELLARPEYGERWARHWLDVVRFGQTAGYENDAEIPFAWRYRDYVIEAFNADKPFDQFVREQIAGDELDEVTAESLIATGFYRLGPWDSEPDDERQAELDGLDDVVRTISEGFLGLTVGCARCHDHRFDPIAQDDYYGLLAFVNNVRPMEKRRFATDSATLTPLGFTRDAERRWELDRDRHVQQLEARWRDKTRGLRRELSKHVTREHGADVRQAVDPRIESYTDEQARVLQEAFGDHPLAGRLLSETTRDLNALDREIDAANGSFEGDLDWALSVREHGGVAPATHLLVRGDHRLPAHETPPRFPRVANRSDEDSWPSLPAPDAEAPSSERRRVLAEWVASASNPLTARVIVNRIWQHHFGRGLVATPNDFGAMGLPPTHPQLLDWLAAEFVQSGWSIKTLHRLIMSSSTYRRASVAANAEARRIDPDNTLLWRQHMRRLEAEELHDAMLVVSGALNPERGGRGFFPRLDRQALAGASRPGQGWEPSAEEQRNRRAVYSFVKRNLLPPLLDVFDAPDPSLPTAVRSSTTVASQALTLLNGEFSNRQAAAFAARLVAEAGEDEAAQIRRAYELLFARQPSAQEAAIASGLLHDLRAALADEPRQGSFASRVPARLDGGYLELATGEDLLAAPAEGWRVLPGRWGNDYNGTLEPLPGQHPTAILKQPRFRDGAVKARMFVERGSELSSLLLRSAPDDGGVTGVEVRVDCEAGRVALLLHEGSDAGGDAGADAGAGAGLMLAQADADLGFERGFDLRVRMDGPRVRVWIDGSPCLDESDPRLSRTGKVGVRTWGAGLRLAQLDIKLAEGLIPALDGEAGSTDREALEFLCLALFNLNEFLHVD